MHFEGDFQVAAPQERVFEAVTTPREVAGCMPGLQKLDVRSADAFEATIRVGAGFVKGDFAMRFRIEDKSPPSRARMLAQGNGLGSVVDIEIALKLDQGERGGTHLNWAADARVGGKLASVGQRLIESTARKIISQFFECFRGRIEGP